MQNDEVVWQIINHGHCSFKAKSKTQNFCRNEYNVSGLCNRSSCPLANTRYATIKEVNGRCYLYMKTAERSHMPKKLWQRIRLKRNYMQALEQVDQHLQHWPKFLVHKNKQRLTKITQYLIRMRKLAMKVKPKLVTMPRRTEKQLRRKEAKAEVAGRLDKAIEAELLSRLQSGTYGDIYNFPLKQFSNVLDRQELELEEAEGQQEEEEEEVEHFIEGDEEEDDEEEEEVEYLDDVNLEEEGDLEDYEGQFDDDEEGASEGDTSTEGASEQESEEDDDDEGDVPRQRKRKAGRRPSWEAGKRRKNVEIEYEMEREDIRQ